MAHELTTRRLALLDDTARTKHNAYLSHLRTQSDRADTITFLGMVAVLLFILAL